MITVLAGGVGGAKFLAGLAGVIDPREITAIVNTGDDINLHGLHISPDLDTVCYTLGGQVHPLQGWGVDQDTFHCLGQLERMGEETWFRLGDRDLATHLLRTRWLGQGLTLSQVTARLTAMMGVAATLLPMTDAFVPTQVLTDQGELHFQEYFVRDRCQAPVRGFRFSNIEFCKPAAGVLEAIHGADAVILAPSNPFISIGPILAVPGIQEALREVASRVAAISPIIQGRAVKGPAADMLEQLGYEVSAVGIARIYRDFASTFILDLQDEDLAGRVEALGLRALVADTVMDAPGKQGMLAKAVLEGMRR
jgi:LPPG:FO 2-phospho-L-lactate transferase